MSEELQDEGRMYKSLHLTSNVGAEVKSRSQRSRSKTHAIDLEYCSLAFGTSAELRRCASCLGVSLSGAGSVDKGIQQYLLRIGYTAAVPTAATIVERMTPSHCLHHRLIVSIGEMR